ncbi:MAG: hypothetical protein NUV78_02025 [Candidatus Zambryskibacteria bacterium]|nr:hypothetical protein [Candidatus Zambryskibacteria bacterium]
MTNKLRIAILLLVLALASAGLYYGAKDKAVAPVVVITTFGECRDAGYPIMESYPEQCRTPDGRNFIRGISDPIIPPNNTGGGNGGSPVTCTMDAMQCPDGSYVGRSGPKCEFVCPTPASGSGVRGIVMLGPTCPVVQDPPDSECDDKPFKTNLVLTTADGVSIVKSFSSDAQGKFSIAVSPGYYLIRSAPGGPIMPSCAKGEVIEVRANSYTVTTVSCDTGIR